MIDDIDRLRQVQIVLIRNRRKYLAKMGDDDWDEWDEEAPAPAKSAAKPAAEDDDWGDDDGAASPAKNASA